MQTVRTYHDPVDGDALTMDHNHKSGFRSTCAQVHLCAGQQESDSLFAEDAIMFCFASIAVKFWGQNEGHGAPYRLRPGTLLNTSSVRMV